MKKIELEIVALKHSVTQTHNYAVILGEKEGVRRLPIIIGANVGTTATSLLAAASLDTSARRTAMSHTLYNLGGALIFLPFLTPFGRLLLTLELSPEGTLAAAHLAFNLVTATIFLVFTEPFARLITRLVPDDVAETEPIAPLTRAAFDENPDTAVRSFVATVVDAQQATYIASVLAIETRDGSIANRASRGAAMVDFALEEIATLVRELSSGDPGPERSEAILRMVITVDHARQIQDSLADLRRIAAEGPSYVRQRRVVAEGGDLTGVVHALRAELAESIAEEVAAT